MQENIVRLDRGKERFENDKIKVLEEHAFPLTIVESDVTLIENYFGDKTMIINACFLFFLYTGITRICSSSRRKNFRSFFLVDGN